MMYIDSIDRLYQLKFFTLNVITKIKNEVGP